MPLRIAPAPDGQHMLVLTGGYHDHGLALLDPRTGRLSDSILLGSVWAGLAVAHQSGEAFISAGAAASEARPLSALPEFKQLDASVRAAAQHPILRVGVHGSTL